MSTISDMIESVKRVDALLADLDLQPNPDRADWAAARKKVEGLKQALDEEIAPQFDQVMAEVEGEEIGPLVRRRTAHLYAEAAAVFQASGDGIRAAEWLRKAQRHTPDEEHEAELVAAQKEPAVFARLVLARWFLTEGRFDEADREAKRVRREAKEAVLRARAKKILDGPRPLRGGAPSLFTLNGFGTGLYGARDHDGDGWYVATLCICFLFIPVFPIAAYRVKRIDARSYRFIAREKLSPFARAVRAIVGLGAVTAIAVTSIGSYLDSADHRAAVALDEARASEKAGKDDVAIEAYARIVGQFSASAGAARDAAEGVARLAAKKVPAPCTGESVEAVRSAANAFVSLREEARAGASVTPLVKRLDACATEIGDGDADHARAALRVLDLAADAAGTGGDAGWVEARRSAARRAFALTMAEARPLLALAELSRLSDKESVAAAKQVILGLGDGAVWIDARPDIDRWAHEARRAGDDASANEVMAKLSAASTAHEATQKLIASSDEKAVAKAAAEHPGDQALAVAVAGHMRSRGDGKGALALLSKLGPPGRLTAEAQEALATALADSGDLAKADEILSALVDERLPAFQDAQRAFNAAADAAQSKITGDLKIGVVPPDLKRRMEGALDETKKREEIQAWLGEKLAADPALTILRAEYLARGQAVPAALSLGTVKLRRAASASGAERKRLLDQAERAYLAIRDEAAADPSFHLGLGQVYFRLGKKEEGEKELQSVLDRKVPELSLGVAHTFRELGLFSRARQVARSVYDQPGIDQDARYSAADLLTVMAPTLDEEEDWLRRGDPTQPAVRVGLDRVQGIRLLREGKEVEADRKFKRCVDYFDRTAKTNAVSANNAATETIYRYRATGDLSHLRSAVRYLESAVRLEPGSALVLGNLAGVLAQLGYVTVLDRWIDTRALVLGHGDARTLVSSMLDGPLAGEVIEALRKDASFQRALDVSQQLQVLAPQMRGAYAVPIAWHLTNHDVKALEEIDKRLDMLPGSSDSDADVQAKWRSGERDEIALRDAQDAAAMARRTVERVKGGSKATQAAAWVLLANAIEELSFFQHDDARIDEMVDAIHKARAAWPEGVTRGEVSTALFLATFYHALPASPALAKAWEAERREHAAPLVAYRAMSGPDGAEVTAAIRKDPLLAEMVSVRKQPAAVDPTLRDHIFATLAGDAELRALAAKVFDRREAELSYAIESKLAPDDKDAQLSLALFRGRGTIR